MVKYYQARLEQKTPNGVAQKVAWIEEKGASLGARVELKGEQGLWEVKTIDLSTHLTNVEISDQQRKNRNAAPSLEGLA